MVWTCDERTNNEDWLKKIFGDQNWRPIETWLENVETDMAELEIDREDIHDKKKWRQNVIVINYAPRI